MFVKSRAEGSQCGRICVWEGRCAWQVYHVGPILVLGMAFRQESCVSVPHCGHVWLQAGGCLMWYVFLRPYMKQASDANGVAFGPIFV